MNTIGAGLCLWCGEVTPRQQVCCGYGCRRKAIAAEKSYKKFVTFLATPAKCCPVCGGKIPYGRPKYCSDACQAVALDARRAPYIPKTARRESYRKPTDDRETSGYGHIIHLTEGRLEREVTRVLRKQVRYVPTIREAKP